MVDLMKKNGDWDENDVKMEEEAMRLAEQEEELKQKIIKEHK